MNHARVLGFVLAMTGCTVDDEVELGEITSALNGSFPGYVTTTFGSDVANRCAVDPVTDLNNLVSDRTYIIAYRSGKSACSVYAPYHNGGLLIHRQSIQRLYRGSKNYFLVSGSVNSGELPGFEIVDMAAHGSSTGLLFNAGVTPTTYPNCTDHVVSRFTSDTTVRLHAGGMQTIGRYAVVGFEDPNNNATAYFETVDLATPTSPIEGPLRLRSSGQITNAGAAAMTRTSDLTYLTMIFGNGANDVEVFVSSGTTMPTTSAGWISKGSWTLYPLQFSVNYENVQLITRCDGSLYALATHKNGSGEDWADLYRVTLNASTFQPTFAKVAWKHLYCSTSHTNNIRYCDFDAGAGPFIDSNGHLIVYGIEHYDDAYPGGGEGVKVREF